MNPWPSAYTLYNGKQLKIWEAWACDEETEDAGDALPGTVLEVAKDYLRVSTGEGSLKLYSLQLEGKKRMSTHDFLLGVKVQTGTVLG